MTSSGKFGIALLSFAHVHARGYADQVRDHRDCEAVAIWDEDPERGQAEAEARGIPFVSDLEAVLALPDVEGVVVNAPTSMHKDILVAAANAGKHIFTEKSLTITPADATEVLLAVEHHSVKFMISLPSRTRPEILFARKVIDQGLLGEVTQARARIAHMAALDRWFSGGTNWFGDEMQAGGGAFFDLGCHRVDVIRWLLGVPTSVVAQMTNFSGAYDVDDSMVAAITFQSKAIAIIDVSWVHRFGPNPLEFYGTEGYLGIDVSVGGPRVQLISSKLNAGEFNGVISPTSLPAALPSPFHQWVASIREGTMPMVNIYDAVNLVQLLDGCYRAGREGREITF